jgi:hypothetical protein
MKSFGDFLVFEAIAMELSDVVLQLLDPRGRMWHD